MFCCIVFDIWLAQRLMATLGFDEKQQNENGKRWKYTLLISFQMDWNGLSILSQTKRTILKLYSNLLSRVRGSDFEYEWNFESSSNSGFPFPMDWLIKVHCSFVFHPESKNPTTGNRWNNLIASPIIGSARTPSPPNIALLLPLLLILWKTGKPKHATFCWKESNNWNYFWIRNGIQFSFIFPSVQLPNK